MEQEAGRAPRQGLRVVFASLRMQIMLLLLTCYLIPALTLSVFIQTKLIPSLREKTVSALTTDAEHAWTLARQNIDLAIDLAREAIYDGELASVYESWAGGGLADAEYLRLSRSYIDRKYSRSSQFTFAGYFPVDAPELYMYTRSGYNEAVRFLEEGQRQALALGQVVPGAQSAQPAHGTLRHAGAGAQPRGAAVALAAIGGELAGPGIHPPG